MYLSMQKSGFFYIARAFAIFSVICAHMNFGEGHLIANTIRNSLGEIGVCVFFVISGFFYNRKSNDSIVFWRKKLSHVITPWFLMSTLVFLISAVFLHATKLSLISFLKNFFGFGTHYWYMTVLIIMFILFQFISKKWQYISCLIISVISVYTSAVLLAVFSLRINQFLNIFNWVGFFALGIVLRKTDTINIIISRKNKIILLFSSITCMFVCVYVQVLTNIPTNSYISFTSLLFEISGMIIVFLLASVLCDSKLLIDIGKKSYFIYLTHIQIVGFISTRLPYNTLFFVLRPFICLMICYILSVLFAKALKWFRLEKLSVFFGIK